MTPEQELTAMIEAELAAHMMRHAQQFPMPMGGDIALLQLIQLEELATMPEPDRQNAALRKLYWLATDSDDIVH